MAFEQLIKFAHAAATAPTHAFEFDGRVGHGRQELPRVARTAAEAGTQARRSIISFLISAIASAGFKPLGQVRAQFMMVWQR